MKFIEVDLIGVYVAPIALLIIVAWFVNKAIRVRSRNGQIVLSGGNSYQKILQ